MPRKPLAQQRRYDLSTRGANHVITWCRKDCKDWNGLLKKRYFIGRVAGVIRTPRMKPLLHRGKKP